MSTGIGITGNPEYNGGPDQRAPLTSEQREQVAFKLRETVQYLDENGWVRRRWYTSTGQMCALTALRRTCGVLKRENVTMFGRTEEREAWVIDEDAFGDVRGDLYTAARRELEVCIGARAPSADTDSFEFKYGSIPDWNDAETRTEDEVKQTMLDCADRVESQGENNGGSDD